MSIPLNPRDLDDKLFRIKKLQYNTYEIDHPQIQGTLRLMNVPSNIMHIPDEKIPPNQKRTAEPTFMVGGQIMVSFTNKGKKKRTDSQSYSRRYEKGKEK